jgi:RHH-type proline utilization regulon transcriptional repressor/proline dehydrogenase/delta 1-pyrroline-5-carboxylate dehydrogenase
MPKALAQAFHVIKDIKTDAFDAVLHHGTTAQLSTATAIAERQGAIVGYSAHHKRPFLWNVLD